MLQKDVKKDKKRHKTDTRDSTTHEKSSKATKLIVEPKKTKISTKMEKREEHNRMCLEKNMEK